MTRRLLLATGLCMVFASGAVAEVKVGERAPAVAASKWWNLPKGMTRLDPKDLKGQIVLVEFWATW